MEESFSDANLCEIVILTFFYFSIKISTMQMFLRKFCGAYDIFWNLFQIMHLPSLDKVYSNSLYEFFTLLNMTGNISWLYPQLSNSLEKYLSCSCLLYVVKNFICLFTFQPQVSHDNHCLTFNISTSYRCVFQKLTSNETEEGTGDLEKQFTFKSFARNNKKLDISERYASTGVKLLKQETPVQNIRIGSYMCLL